MGNTMATILKKVIQNGGMPLTQVNERIETMYLNGRINADERSELIELMHEKADQENEKGGWEEIYRALKAKYEELSERMTAAEKALGIHKEAEGEQTDGYPAWEPWDGVGPGYQTGVIVSHEGGIWENTLVGRGNVWEPGAPGIDERYWRKIA